MLLQFPKGFFWGAASASYQVEGGIYNTDWAYEARTSKRVPIADSGPDHFTHFEQDFDLAKKLGHNAHRFSIEWARIEPSEGEFSADAIRHYRKVIRALKSRGLTPFVTLWHFTLPQWLYAQGGAASKKFPEQFARYAAYVAEHLGDEVEHWVTMNEPLVFTGMGWIRGEWPPLQKHAWYTSFRVALHLVDAHKRAYLKIKEKDLTAEVGLVKHNKYVSANWNPWNKLQARIVDYVWNHWFLERTKTHIDTIGLNYYSHRRFGDRGIYKKSDMGWNIYPEGLYHTLVALKRYKKPVFVSEAGIADHLDIYRGQYITDLVRAAHRALDEGVMLKGFMYWSLTDNFEWAHGYDKRFGLIEIDYKTKDRHIRDSAYVYKDICMQNGVTIPLE